MRLKQSKRKTKICKICFKNIEDNSFHCLLNFETKICRDCFNKFKVEFSHFKISNKDVLSLYEYDEFMQSMLYQFKGCFDYELKDIFLEYFLYYLKIKYHNYIIVPAPSYIKSDEIRGFNHVEEIYKCLHLEMNKCIHKTMDFKQSDYHKDEREKVDKKLCIDDVNLCNKKVLIVDDVCTTGSTIKAMIKLLNSKNPKQIKVLILSHTKEKN